MFLWRFNRGLQSALEMMLDFKLTQRGEGG